MTVKGKALTSSVALWTGTLTATALLVYVTLSAGRVGMLSAAAIAAVLIAWAVPTSWIPPIALCVWALVPRRISVALLDIDIVYPLVGLIAIWAVKTILMRGRANTPDPARQWWIAIASALVVWLIFAAARNGAWGAGITWTLAFIVLCVLPAILIDKITWSRILSMWLGLATLLGVYAVIEAALQKNLVYGTIFSALGDPSEQHWSVYRADVSFSHPLYASLFFSTALALGVGAYMEHGRKWHLLAATASAAGVAATVSRSGLAAAAAATAVVLLVAILRKNTVSTGLKVGASIVVIAGLIWASQLGAFSERSESAEAGTSSVAREWVFDLAIEASSRSAWLGTGPGTSADAVRALDSYQILVENGYLQLLVSTGIVGLALFVALLAMGGSIAISRQRYAGLGGLIAFAVSIAGFNGLESNPTIMLMLGFALGGIWSTGIGAKTSADHPARSVSASATP